MNPILQYRPVKGDPTYTFAETDNLKFAEFLRDLPEAVPYLGAYQVMFPVPTEDFEEYIANVLEGTEWEDNYTLERLWEDN